MAKRRRSREMELVKSLSRGTQPISSNKSPGIGDMLIPNHSGDHSAGRVLSQPEGDTDIVNKLYVDTEIGNKIEDGTAAGQLTYWDGSQWVHAETSELCWDDTSKNLGVGTDSPGDILDWEATSSNNILHLAGNAGARLVAEGTAVANLDLISGNSTEDSRWGNLRCSSDKLTFSAINDDATAFSKANILAMELDTGNVGIGTNAPDDRFHVVDGNARVDRTSTGVAFIANRTDGVALNLKAGGAGQFTFDDSSSFFIAKDTKANILTGSGSGTKLMTILKTGEIGINTITPSEKLQVVGRIIEEGTFGAICVHDNSTTQSIPTGSTYTKITAFDTDNNSSNMTVDTANSKLTITKAGKYLVNGSFSIESGKANVSFLGSAFLNGTEQNCIHWRRKISTANSEGVAAFTGIIDVTSNNQDLDFRVRHDDGGSVNFLLTYGNMNCSYLGET